MGLIERINDKEYKEDYEIILNLNRFKFLYIQGERRYRIDFKVVFLCIQKYFICLIFVDLENEVCWIGIGEFYMIRYYLGYG